ncbi:MAG TPA: outer membrane protein assembly factor BamA [Gammaproteobacteria bacterium]|nr:outer membrane protein assembly factor BamA [Gammaproteobacteria bacterium]
MPGRHIAARVLVVLTLAACLGLPAARAADSGSFTVQNIRVIGLERISKATVLTYIPQISVGQTVGPADISKAITSLYQTGFFTQVQFRRDGSTLVIVVRERPTIAEVALSGNKQLKTADLEKGLEQAGLTKGSFFNRAALEGIEGSLIQTYFDHGRYGVQVHSTVRPLPNNRVLIAIRIREGANAKVLAINFTGNKAFDAGTLRGRFKMSTPGWLTWITGKDKYAEEKLQGSLENLRSFYMDRGYADFRVNSVQVQISPDKSGIYINVNLHEGGKYKIGSVKLLGEFPIAQEKLENLLFIKPGSTFSMQVANAQAQLLTNELGNFGYGFAEVNPLPHPDPKTHKVELVFYVKPGQRVYVRHVVFSGAPGTNDSVFRREMRQAEGSWLNNFNLQRSRVRIQRLPFVDTVDVKPVRVPGTSDQVDVNVNVKERQSGTANVFLAYSGLYGLGFGGEVALSNLFGEGKLLHLNASKNSSITSVTADYTDPYATANGVSRTLSLFYSKGTSLNINSSQFVSKNYGGGVTYGFPLSEFDSYSLGGSLRHGTLTPFCNSSLQFFDFVRNPANGNVSFQQSYCGGLDPTVPVNVALPNLTYTNFVASAGYVHDTRNRTVLPSRGTLQQFSVNLALPIGDETFYTASWNQFTFVPLGAGFIYGINSLVGIGGAYGKTSDLPPYERFFSGGPDSVAGYEDGTLGPLDSNGLPYGGDFVTWVQNELVLPNFIGGPDVQNSYRFALFIDAGNVFNRPSDFSFSYIRMSYGVGVTWLTPIGALHFSYAVPFHYRIGDNLARFQFTLGAYF